MTWVLWSAAVQRLQGAVAGCKMSVWHCLCRADDHTASADKPWHQCSDTCACTGYGMQLSNFPEGCHSAKWSLTTAKYKTICIYRKARYNRTQHTVSKQNKVLLVKLCKYGWKSLTGARQLMRCAGAVVTQQCKASCTLPHSCWRECNAQLHCVSPI